MFGWSGSMLHIDLTTQNVSRVDLDESLRMSFLGGRGINSRLLYRETGPDVDPLGPDNVLIFGSSPLCGTVAPSCSRCTVTAKSPLTGILGDANFGGFFSPAMKKAGHDLILITGRSEHPVYLLITPDMVKCKNAQHLWGMGIRKAEELLLKENDIAGLSCALIGPAGENRVRFACIVHRYNAAGRTGMGAVMGSKNLKAVCVAGTGKTPVAHPDLFSKVRKNWLAKINDNPFTKFFGTYGSAGPLDREADSGILAVRNFGTTGKCDGVERISAQALQKYFTKSNACFACPVHCIQSYEFKDAETTITGTKMPEGCNSSCGPSCGNTDPASLFIMNNLANDYGMDILDFGLLMATAMDWYANGVINGSDTDHIDLDWGNHEAMVSMLHKIARREGFGNILAEGAVKAAEMIGRNAGQYVSSSKGMIFGGVDPRVLRGSSLCYATGTRGGDHLRGGVLIELPMAGGKNAISAEEAIERFGTADVLDPVSYNKVSAAAFFQDMYTIADCLEICKFITAHNGHGITMKDISAMLHAVTGIQLSINDLRTVANRVFTVERAFLAREGIRKKDDFLYGKWTSGPVPSGKYNGAAVDRGKWDNMLEEYYAFRGWDTTTGIPLPETLRCLGLEDVAQDMAALL